MAAKLRLESIQEAAQRLVEADRYVSEVCEAVRARGFNVADDDTGYSVSWALAIMVHLLSLIIRNLSNHLILVGIGAL